MLNLLPGLRDLRTPLAVGYLWITVLWLAFANKVPEREEAHGLVADVYGIAGALGGPTLLGAISFIAYVVGVLMAPLTDLLLTPVWNWALMLVRISYSGASGPWYLNLDTETAADLRKYVDRQLNLLVHQAAKLGVEPERLDEIILHANKRSERPTGSDIPQHQRQRGVSANWWDYPDRLANWSTYQSRVEIAIFTERDTVVTKLQMQERDSLFQAYDRSSSEGEFRRAITLPIAALVALLVVRGSFWFLFGLVAPFVLVSQGLSKDQEANRIAYRALFDNVVQSATIEHLSGQIARSAQRPPAQESRTLG